MPMRHSFYVHYLKPGFDRGAAAVALLLCAPLMAAIAVSVRIWLGTPVLFRQVRAGKNGRLFVVYKFRTMTSAYDQAGRPLSDEERMTAFGNWLRSTSLDELPELWNVLRGEMSLVGPRPLLKEYLALYSPRQRRRHEVKPGLTGLSQVSGRNALDWPARLEMDVQYVDRVSLPLDVRILLATVWCVLLRRGIRAEGHVTMRRFMGQVARQSEAA